MDQNSIQDTARDFLDTREQIKTVKDEIESLISGDEELNALMEDIEKRTKELKTLKQKLVDKSKDLSILQEKLTGLKERQNLLKEIMIVKIREEQPTLPGTDAQLGLELDGFKFIVTDKLKLARE